MVERKKFSTEFTNPNTEGDAGINGGYQFIGSDGLLADEVNKIVGNTVYLKQRVTHADKGGNAGIAGGLATLDSNGKVPLVQISDAILGQMIYAGSVNVQTGRATLTTNAQKFLGTTSNTINLTNNTANTTGFTANQGNYFVVSDAGTFAGIAFRERDWLVANASGWARVSNTDAVTSVHGRTGAVVLSSADIGAIPVSSIVNNLTTQVADRVLDARQGTALAGRITALENGHVCGGSGEGAGARVYSRRIRVNHWTQSGNNFTLTISRSEHGFPIGGALMVMTQVETRGSSGLIFETSPATARVDADGTVTVSGNTRWAGHIFVQSVGQTADPAVYGVRIDTQTANSNTAVIYTDDAVGMTPSRTVSGVYNAGTIDSVYPYNSIRPCLLRNGQVIGYLNPNNFTQFEDGRAADITNPDAGDVMIEIPHFYYSISRSSDNRFVDVKISEMFSPGFTDRAFSYNGVVKDKFYIGAYLGHILNGRLRSISGVLPSVSQPLSHMRGFARANNSNNVTGYEQLSYNKLVALQVLYLIQFRHLNSQSALGQGHVAFATFAQTGGTNRRGMNAGDSGSVSEAQVKFNGIEDMWGNAYQWIDGYRSRPNDIVISDGNFNDSGTGYTPISYRYQRSDRFGPLTWGTIADVVGNNELAFTPTRGMCSYPELNGSSNFTTPTNLQEHYADFGTVRSNHVPFFGGFHWGHGSSGMFYFYCYSPGSARQDTTARLVYNG